MSEHTTCPETGQPTFLDIDGWRHRDGTRCEHIGRRYRIAVASNVVSYVVSALNDEHGFARSFEAAQRHADHLNQLHPRLRHWVELEDSPMPSDSSFPALPLRRRPVVPASEPDGGRRGD